MDMDDGANEFKIGYLRTRFIEGTDTLETYARTGCLDSDITISTDEKKEFEKEFMTYLDQNISEPAQTRSLLRHFMTYSRRFGSLESKDMSKERNSKPLTKLISTLGHYTYNPISPEQKKFMKDVQDISAYASGSGAKRIESKVSFVNERLRDAGINYRLSPERINALHNKEYEKATTVFLDNIVSQ